jgi:hypothetical protein
MVAASFDVIMAAAFAVAFFFNRQSIVLLLAYALWELAFLLPINDFFMSLIGATIYAVLAAAFIRILSSLRYAMLAISCLYYLNAVDFWLSNGYETLYYNSVSYLIGAVEVYALWQLMKGSFGRARIHSIVNRGFFHL